MSLGGDMPAPYSQDLRERVAGAIAQGVSARAAARRFDISISTAIRWAQRWRGEGHAQARAMGGDHRSRLKEHRAFLLELIAREPDLTLREMRSALAARGVTVGLMTVWRFLAAHKLTLKKGTVRNFVRDQAVHTDQAMAVVKRSRNKTANWDLAMAHSRGGMIHSFSERFKTRKRSLVAASSLGKWPLALTARRSLEFSASMAFVTGMRIAVPARLAGIGSFPAYGATIRDEGHREHAEWAGRCIR